MMGTVRNGWVRVRHNSDFGIHIAMALVIAIFSGMALPILLNATGSSRRADRSVVVRLADDCRTVEAWSPGGVLVWESEPGDPGHDVLLSIIAEATAADTLTTRTLPEEGPST